MTSALIVFYIFVAIALIGLVLLQDPKGGGGAIFGGGGGQSLFGATGATSFIVKATRVIAILFALCVIGLNYSLMKQGASSAIDTDTEISEPVLGGGAVEKDTIKKKEESPAVDSESKTDDTDTGEKQ